MCKDHESSSALGTPRYFAAETLSSSTLYKIYVVFKGLTFLVIWGTWHLEGLNCISHIFSHCSRHARSICRTWPSVVELIAMYMAVPTPKKYWAKVCAQLGILKPSYLATDRSKAVILV